MMKKLAPAKKVTLYMARTGRTVWEDQARIESAAGVPLSDEGVREVLDLAGELNDVPISAVYCPPGEAEKQTAKLLAKQLGVKRHTVEALREIDYGLWQGLTAAEIKRRQPRVFRQWKKTPKTVQPPGGESLGDLEQRLRRAVRDIIRRRKGKGSPLLVLRPVALTLLRSILREEDVEALWTQGEGDFTWGAYETDDQLI
jgi:broad specificity phosphatase PhoE